MKNSLIEELLAELLQENKTPQEAAIWMSKKVAEVVVMSDKKHSGERVLDDLYTDLLLTAAYQGEDVLKRVKALLGDK